MISRFTGMVPFVRQFGFCRSLSRSGVALLLLAVFFAGAVQSAETPVKVGVLKFGTVNWELKSMKHGNFDKSNGVDVEIVPYASGDACLLYTSDAADE